MKTELAKMLSGELYDASDAQLLEMRIQARKLFTAYNQTPFDDVKNRERLLQALFGKAGEGLDIQAPFYCDYGSNIFTGKKVFMNFNCVILDCGRVEIGDFVFFAPNVQIYTAHHPIDARERIKGPELASSIVIGNNVWLGGGTIVCPGVSIGDSTTIGAGSVVTRSIPANVVAAGNPCRVIRTLDA